MNDKERNIEMDVADAIMERPAGFTVGKRSFFIHPVTLGKMYLLARLFDSLEISKQVVSTNPYMEAIRICKRNVILSAAYSPTPRSTGRTICSTIARWISVQNCFPEHSLRRNLLPYWFSFLQVIIWIPSCGISE